MQGSLQNILTAWYNLPFSLMFMLCVIFALAQALGLGGEHESDSDAGVDTDADFDADADADADADGDGDMDADTDADANADVEHDAEPDAGALEPGGALGLLAFVGVGKAPLAVVLSMLLGSIAVTGWALNRVVEVIVGAYPGALFAGVLLLSIVVGGLITARGSRLLGRALPPVSTTATRERALVGQTGTVVSPAIDNSYGLVRVRDRSGTMINVFARSDGAARIVQGAVVVLTSYDDKDKRFGARAADQHGR